MEGQRMGGIRFAKEKAPGGAGSLKNGLEARDGSAERVDQRLVHSSVC